MNIRSIVSILLILWTASLSAQISVNTWFDVLVDKPIDDRMDLATIGDTTTIDFPANGLLAYIEDADEHWYYNGSMWVKMEGGKIDSVYVRGDSMFVSETGIEFYIGASDAAIAQALEDSIAAIGSGTANYIPKWIDANTLGDSPVAVDSANAELAILSGYNIEFRDGVLTRWKIEANGENLSFKYNNGSTKYLTLDKDNQIFVNRYGADIDFFIGSGSANVNTLFVTDWGLKTIGINTYQPAYALDMSGTTTSALRLPQTPTASRPVGVNGLLFYDPTTTWYHGYRNGSYNTFVTGVSGGAVNLNWAGYINMPKNNAAQEAALTGMSVGDIMYNSQSSKTRIYTSAGWGDITPWVTNVTGSTWNNGAAVNIGVFSSYPVTDGLYTSNSARIVFGESGGGSSQSGLVFSRNPIGIGHSGSPASMPGILTVSTNRINNSTYPGLANRHLVTIFPSSGNSFNALPWSSSGQGYGLIGSPASSTVYRHNLLVMPQGSSTPKIKFNAIPILGKEYTGYTNAVILNSNSSTGSSVGSALLVQTVNSTRQEFAATVMSGIDVSAVVDSFYVDAGSTSMYAVGLRAYSKIGDDVVDTVGIDMLSVGIIAEAYGPDSTYAILSKAGKNFFQDTVQVATAPTNTAPEGGVLVRDSDGNVGKKMMDNGVLFATTDGAGEATIIFNVTMPDASYTINLFNVATGVTSCYPVSTTTTGMTVRVYDSGGAVVSTGVTIHWSVIDN